MKRAENLTVKIKNFVINFAQVVARSIQGGLTTVQYVEIKAKISSADFVSRNLEGALLFSTRAAIQDYAADEASAREGVVLEMGVFDGGSINRMARRMWLQDAKRKVYGLDSFKGLEESWSSTDHHGRFDVGGVPPKGIDSKIHLIHGRVEEVLEHFLHTENPTFALIHFDMDLYAPTKFALTKLLPHLSSGTLILFDELYGYPGWEFGEYKALSELVPTDKYRYLAFGPIQTLIEIL